MLYYEIMSEPLRLIFQGSIIFETPEKAESWYEALKRSIKIESSTASINGQITKSLEPCCHKKPEPKP